MLLFYHLNMYIRKSVIGDKENQKIKKLKFLGIYTKIAERISSMNMNLKKHIIIPKEINTFITDTINSCRGNTYTEICFLPYSSGHILSFISAKKCFACFLSYHGVIIAHSDWSDNIYNTYVTADKYGSDYIIMVSDKEPVEPFADMVYINTNMIRSTNVKYLPLNTSGWIPHYALRDKIKDIVDGDLGDDGWITEVWKNQKGVYEAQDEYKMYTKTYKKPFLLYIPEDNTCKYSFHKYRLVELVLKVETPIAGSRHETDYLYYFQDQNGEVIEFSDYPFFSKLLD